MAEKTVFIKELNCEACEKLVSKVAGRHSVSVGKVDFKKKTASLNGDEAGIAKTAESLDAMGYAVSFEKIPEKGRGKERFSNFISGVFFGREGFNTQSKSLEIFIYSLAGLLAVTVLLNFSGVMQVTKYSYYTYLAAFGIAMLVATAWHISAYFDYFTHMNGMMIGMTLGMTAGFLAGAIIGATNGMFIGSIAGVAAGIILGVYWGNCCGVMGILEGLMGGVMAGTMGAMLSVMMVFDHLNEFLALLFLAFASILLGLNYMVYKETLGENSRKISMVKPLVMGIIAFVFTILIILYAPHSVTLTVSGN